MTSLLGFLRRRFLAGILVVVPAIATLAALRFLFRTLDGVLGPWIATAVGREVPGLGILATLLTVLLAGVVAANLFGQRVVAAAERLIDSIPIARGIYRASRQIVATATLSERQAFREVVMVEYPRKGIYSYGFVTATLAREEPGGRRRLANVFIPGPPVPTTGVLIAVPEEELFYLDISAEDALKLVLSGGLVSPELLRERSGRPTEGSLERTRS